MAIEDSIEETKVGIKTSFHGLIESAKDPTGTKALIDRIWTDMESIGTIYKAEKEGKPIDLEEAERVCSEVDEFILQSKKIPGVGALAGIAGI